MYKNIPDAAIDLILNDPLELAKLNDMRSNGFVDREKYAPGVFEDDNDDSIDTEPAPGPKLVVFDGDGNVDWDEFKPVIVDDDEDRINRKIKEKYKERIQFWTDDDPIFNGKSKPDNTIEYFLKNQFNKNGTRKTHFKDRILCEICGCAIRRSLITQHLRTKKHRRAAADLDMRIQARMSSKNKVIAIPADKELNDIIQRKVNELFQRRPLQSFK